MPIIVYYYLLLDRFSLYCNAQSPRVQSATLGVAQQNGRFGHHGTQRVHHKYSTHLSTGFDDEVIPTEEHRQYHVKLLDRNSATRCIPYPIL